MIIIIEIETWREGEAKVLHLATGTVIEKIFVGTTIGIGKDTATREIAFNADVAAVGVEATIGTSQMEGVGMSILFVQNDRGKAIISSKRVEAAQTVSLDAAEAPPTMMALALSSEKRKKEVTLTKEGAIQESATESLLGGSVRATETSILAVVDLPPR